MNITETQIIANELNTWFNSFSVSNQDKYVITADYAPLENERFNSQLERFYKNPDEVAKQQIESDKIRGLLRTGVSEYDPVQQTFATTKIFELKIRTDEKTNSADVLEDIYNLIHFDKTNGQYNGKVTNVTYGTTTYSIAWGFYTPTVLEPPEAKGGTRYKYITVSGTATIVAEDITNEVNGLYFGDNFILSITGETFGEIQATGVASIEPIYDGKLKEGQSTGRNKVRIGVIDNRLTILYPFRKNDTLALKLFDIAIGEEKTEKYTIKLQIIDNETVIKTYTWNNAYALGSTEPLQLGKLPALNMTFIKSE